MARDPRRSAARHTSDDPLERLERNERSSREAVFFGAGSAFAVGALAVILSVVLGVEGGQGFTTERVEVIGIPLALAVVLSSIATYETYRRWRTRIRWRPWLWLTQLMWLGSTSYLVLMGAVLAAQVPAH